MFKSIIATIIKPLNRALTRSIPIQSIIFHQYRNSQIGTKSQCRSQSTLNLTASTATTYKPLSNNNNNKNITTSIETSLNNDLIPRYLEETYWWAYTNPNAVKFWERQWLVDTILWGNFNLLKTEAIHEINTLENNKTLNIAQIACVYGNFSTDLISNIMSKKKGEYNYKIIDIAPIQLINTKNKIDEYLNEKHDVNNNDDNNNNNKGDIDLNIGLYQNDSMNMESIESNSEDITFLFFLLHEQPKNVRLKTIEETIRITKENGKIIIVDYHKPISNINPFRYIMHPILTYLEPFAIDLWNEQITDYIHNMNMENNWNITMDKTLYFNGLYQKIVLTKK